MAESGIRVEVVCALAERQIVMTVDVPSGATVADAIEQSGIAGAFRELDIAHAPVGIYGRTVSRGTPLRDGDRVEIYRPLVADPKHARRERAAR
jgi:putative ubiquitin-RnfH superfamily antitoxin RatB of RatAB toxin-antitoxin module